MEYQILIDTMRPYGLNKRICTSTGATVGIREPYFSGDTINGVLFFPSWFSYHESEAYPFCT